MKKYVVISVNHNQDYQYYLPLTIWSWRYFGWTPVLMYHGDLNDTGIYSANGFEGLQYYYITDIEGYRSDTITQTSRLYASAGLFNSDDVMITGDCDMMCLSDYWHPDLKKFTVYGHDLTDFTEYPICYLAGTVKMWREIMDIRQGDSVESLMKRDMDQLPNAKSTDFYRYWSTDQQIATMRISGYDQPKEFINRGKNPNGYAVGRVDRGAWSEDHKVFIDCHMHRDLFKAFYPDAHPDHVKKWRQHLTMLENRFPKENWGWFVEYTKEYAKLAYGK